MKRIIKPTSLFWPVFILSVIGLFMIYSASSVIATERFFDPYYFLKRQAIFFSLGCGLMAIFQRVPYQFYKKRAPLLFLLSIILLILVLIPGIGLVRGGARSWIGLASFNIQPAEIVKVTLIIYLCYLNEHLVYPVSQLGKGLMFRLVVILLSFGLVMLQPDLGTGLIIVGGSVSTLFFQGAKIKHFFSLFIFGLSGLVGLILAAPYRIRRLTAFLDPWQDPLGSGFQSIQSLLAIGPGGILGTGFLRGKQKYFYLPEPHNDFIFAVISEELGLIGAGLVIGLFMMFFYRGLKLALFVQDPFAQTLVLGLVTMMTLQAWINIAVVIGVLPVTGLTLPFLSYGGSSLLINFMAVGILLNIESNTV